MLLTGDQKGGKDESMKKGIRRKSLYEAFRFEGIARGEKAILEKRVISHKEAKQRMARWLA